MFSFSYDASRNLLTVVQRGYWSMPVFRDYEREYLARHERTLRQHKGYRVIADCRDYPVQAVEVGEAFGRLFGKLMSENKAHAAIITPSALNKMQAKRAIPSPNVRFFTDEAEAMEWLFSEGSVPA